MLGNRLPYIAEGDVRRFWVEGFAFALPDIAF